MKIDLTHVQQFLDENLKNNLESRIYELRGGLIKVAHISIKMDDMPMEVVKVEAVNPLISKC